MEAGDLVGLPPEALLECWREGGNAACNGPVRMLPPKLSRYAAVATLFMKYGRNIGGAGYLAPQIVRHDRTVHHR